MHGMLPYVKRGSFGYFHMCRWTFSNDHLVLLYNSFGVRGEVGRCRNLLATDETNMSFLRDN